MFFDEEVTEVRSKTRMHVQAIESELYGARFEATHAKGEARTWRMTAIMAMTIAVVCASIAMVLS